MATTITSREFNQDAAGAKRATASGPVFVTNRGQPAHVLLSIEDYRRLSGTSQTIAELLALPGMESAELPLVRNGELAHPANLD